MHASVKFLALATLDLLLSPLAHAQAIGTLTCDDEGGFPPISTPLFAFNVNTDKSASVLDATVYIDISLFPLLLSTESGYYSSCTISNGTASIVMINASVVDVSASGAGAGVVGASSQIYTSVIFTPTQITSGGVTITAKNSATAQARADALAAIKTRGIVLLKGAGVQ